MKNPDLKERYLRRERKLRAAYRRRTVLVFILALIVGLLLGWIGHGKLSTDKKAQPDTLPTQTPAIPEPTWFDEYEPTEEPTAEPAAEPTAELTEEPTEEPTQEAMDMSAMSEPTAELTEEPTAELTEEPTAEPTEEPTAEPTEEPTAEPAAEATEEPAPEATEEPAAEATAEPAPEATEEPADEGQAAAVIDGDASPEPTEEAPVSNVGTKEEPVPMGEGFTFNMEILPDGSPRTSADDDIYYTLPVTMTLARSMNPEYYQEQYAAKYELKGTEAGCELVFDIGQCDGIYEVTLQNALLVVLENEAGEVQPGYQFTNAEIGGATDSLAATGAAKTIYKRYDYGAVADIKYLTMTYYAGGEGRTVYFSLEQPAAAVEPEATAEAVEGEATAEPEATAATEAGTDATVAPTAESGEVSYTIGDESDEIKQMQNKLIKLGYLSGKGDGKYGKWTAAAVSQAQKAFGLEETGVADAKFLEILYSK